MERIAPSQQIQRQVDALLRDGLRDGNVASALMKLGAQRIAQELLETEQRDALGRERYERRAPGAPPRYRNGYERARMRTAEGEVPLAVPQVEGADEPYRSRILAFLRGNSDVLEKLTAEMYARGLSTRDIEDALREATGDALLSKSAVSEVTERLQEEYESFQRRDLSGLAVEYLFLDGLYEALRRSGNLREGILVAWAILADGRKVLLGLRLGGRESTEAWREFLADLLARGLRAPTFSTSDGAPGLIAAIAQAFPKSLRGRCWAHKMRSILAKLPLDAVPEVKSYLRQVRDAATLEAGQAAAAEVLRRFGQEYPSAMRCFEEDLEGSLAELRLPVAHRIHARTTNLIERSFVEERRRTKAVGRFFDEKSALKLVFATLVRASARWSRVHTTPLERAQLDHLRRSLGLDAHPADAISFTRSRVA